MKFDRYLFKVIWIGRDGMKLLMQGLGLSHSLKGGGETKHERSQILRHMGQTWEQASPSNQSHIVRIRLSPPLFRGANKDKGS